jgi:hypothetical protein
VPARFNPFARSVQAFPFSAAQIAEALHGSGVPNASGWVQARCPNHDDHRASLSLKDTPHGLLAKCFAGCSSGDVHAALYRMLRDRPPMAPHTPHEQRKKLDLFWIAARITEGCKPAAGTVVERYLRSRGITILLPATLLCHRSLYHKESRTVGPGMVAVLDSVEGQRAPAIHRTWLALDGSGKAAVDPVRKLLGSVAGHAVHLGTPSPRLIVGEGVETTLSALQMWGPSFDAWATLSTSGMIAVQIPETITEVVIASDNDEAGRTAAWTLCYRLRRERPTLNVNVFVPKNGLSDFNDTLRARAAT